MEDDEGAGGAADRSSIVIGLIENRAKEVGVAAFDLRSASLHLSQYIETSCSYQNTKTLLHFYDPMVIIVPPVKLAPDGMVGVSELVDKHYTSNKKITMSRGCFDDTKGAMLVKNLAAKEPSAIGLDTYYKQYYLCLAATAATIKWIEAEKGVIITNHSLLVTFNGSFDHMNIDAASVQNLEIIDPLHTELWGSGNKKRSLFQMLKTTKTIGGTRLLRANLLQPLKDVKTINARLDCLDELMSNEELFFGLSQGLRKFPKETDKVLCHFCFKPKKVTDEVLRPANGRKSQMLISSIIILKTALDALPFLSKVLKDAKSFLLCNIYRSICKNPKYEEMRKRIGSVIDEDVVHARVPFLACTQQCFAVKAGVDGLLDVARRSFCDTSEAIHNLANKYREEYKLPNLKIPFNNRQGFYFSIPQKDVNGKLPAKFIQVMKHGKNIHCSTFELASLNVRNKSAAAECFMRTEICLEALLEVIREDISPLTLLAEVLCLLDMIVNSFAHTISTKPVDRYTRPEFTDNGPMAIDAGRHPVLESLHNDFVPNNLFLSEASNMIIVMGPNMCGKSTYLQQVCLMVILAQIGCYVPARFASLRVVDRMFTRIGTGDNVEYNSSTFMTEMRETAFLMQNISPKSLIVMDELGRATSSSDGFAIAWSCCEHLLSLKAYTIFATHIEGLSELVTIYPNVKTLHFEVDLRNNRLDFKFRLKDQPQYVPHYGLLLAGVAGLPRSVIETAKNITKLITEKEEKRIVNNCERYHEIQMVYRVAQRLFCLKYSNQNEVDIRQALQDLKDNYKEGFLLKASYSVANTSSEDIDAAVPIKPLRSKINGNIFVYPWASSRKGYVLDASEDKYGGIVINPDKLPRNAYAFASVLHVSLSQWKLEGKKGVWLKLPLERSELVPVAVKEGFKYHHAEESYVMLTYWIPEEPCMLPANASHQVGIGGFVINEKKEVLVVQEKHCPSTSAGVWKLPTGFVLESEDIFTGAVREVKEETGIDTEFVEVVAFRQTHQVAFEKSDLLFICILRPLSSQIEVDGLEIQAAKWIPLADFIEQPCIQDDNMFKKIIDICMARLGKRYCGLSAHHLISNFDGKISTLYYNVVEPQDLNCQGV